MSTEDIDKLDEENDEETVCKKQNWHGLLINYIPKPIK